MRPGTATLLAFGLSACGSGPPPQPEPGTPLEFAGGSVEMPLGADWRLVERQPDIVVFERRLDAPGHELVAIAQVFPFEFEDLEECRASLHRDVYVETPLHRDPHGSVEIVEDASPPYVRVRYSARESATPDPDANWERLDSEFRWYLRPGDRRGIMLSFAERRPEGSQAAAYEGQKRLYFGSFRPASVAAR